MNSITKNQWQERYLTQMTKDSSLKSFWSLPKLAKDFGFNLDEQPLVIKLFLENVMRDYNPDNKSNTNCSLVEIIEGLSSNGQRENYEFLYSPSRVLMQDYTGVPAIADLAAIRDTVRGAGGQVDLVNPQCPVQLVIDHSVIVEQAGSRDAIEINSQSEMARNKERYQFLKWAQSSFDNLTVVPPGRGICHQVNLEYFAQVVCDINDVLFPDTLVGTDSHTTMVNGLGVLGWGVGGIEAEAVMLGEPVILTAPQVVGVELKGKLSVGITATDLVLTITETLRNHGVVGKYVEFYGDGVFNLSVADRATIANMAPEYGATCALFPIDEKVIDYLAITNRPTALCERVYAYAKAQGMFHTKDSLPAIYQDSISIHLNDIVPCIAGPKRPQDRLPLSEIKQKTLDEIALAGHVTPSQLEENCRLNDGDLVIAAITSCTNTSNPHVMLLAGLLAKAAVEKGLTIKPHVKTSLAPGSQVVARYLDDSGLQPYLDKLGFQRVGFGCTTCIGNSGPLNNGLESDIEQHDLLVGAILSGNRNFEGRIHPSVQLNWLASPPLVIAFALAGHSRIDLNTEPLGVGHHNRPIYLKDIWPSEKIVKKALTSVTRKLFQQSYQDLLKGDKYWEELKIEKTVCYSWDRDSTYIHKPPFADIGMKPGPLTSARILAILGNSITTDHISPAGNISNSSPAGTYLIEQHVPPKHFNSYGARRGNHEVMTRGTFANKRLKNKMVEPKEGGYTLIENVAKNQSPFSMKNSIVTIYAASEYYHQNNIPLVVFAGKEYGTGSSRDWAAKGCLLLNVKAVIAESFERIHRSNLVGMGIMPLQLPYPLSVIDLNLTGDESISIDLPISATNTDLVPMQEVTLRIEENPNHPISSLQKASRSIPVTLRIDNTREIDYFKAGGILPYVAAKFSTHTDRGT